MSALETFSLVTSSNAIEILLEHDFLQLDQYIHILIYLHVLIISKIIYNKNQ